MREMNNSPNATQRYPRTRAEISLVSNRAGGLYGLQDRDPGRRLLIYPGPQDSNFRPMFGTITDLSDTGRPQLIGSPGNNLLRYCLRLNHGLLFWILIEGDVECVDDTGGVGAAAGAAGSGAVRVAVEVSRGPAEIMTDASLTIRIHASWEIVLIANTGGEFLPIVDSIIDDGSEKSDIIPVALPKGWDGNWHTLWHFCPHWTQPLYRALISIKTLFRPSPHPTTGLPREYIPLEKHSPPIYGLQNADVF
ncbi:hypothetical protein J6590_012221 [Homalodisca vitripennis]|nr:hypothetical protein J6590_012221 [Homalodisca vitripennis]